MGAQCCQTDRPQPTDAGATPQERQGACAWVRSLTTSVVFVHVENFKEDFEAEPEPDGLADPAGEIEQTPRVRKLHPIERVQGILEAANGGSSSSSRPADASPSYQGQLYSGFKQGRGRMVHEDGTVYSGLWQAGEKCGSGIETWPDGTEYDGEFFRGLKHGHGVYRAGDGGHYTGQFRDDFMQGSGRYRFANGRVYNGQWQEGFMFGSGTMEFNDGSRYEGFFDTGIRCGFGTLFLPDGRSYAGQWVSGKLQGPGVIADMQGKERAVQWCGNGSYVMLDGGAAGTVGPDVAAWCSVVGAAAPTASSRWKVLAPVNVRATPDANSQAVGTREEGELVFGELAGDWLRLAGEEGYVALSARGRQLIVPAEPEDPGPEDLGPEDLGVPIAEDGDSPASDLPRPVPVPKRGISLISWLSSPRRG